MVRVLQVETPVNLLVLGWISVANRTEEAGGSWPTVGFEPTFCASVSCRAPILLTDFMDRTTMRNRTSISGFVDRRSVR